MQTMTFFKTEYMLSPEEIEILKMDAWSSYTSAQYRDYSMLITTKQIDVITVQTDAPVKVEEIFYASGYALIR